MYNTWSLPGITGQNYAHWASIIQFRGMSDGKKKKKNAILYDQRIDPEMISWVCTIVSEVYKSFMHVMTGFCRYCTM